MNKSSERDWTGIGIIVAIAGSILINVFFLGGRISEVNDKVNEQYIQLVELRQKNEKVAGCIIRATEETIKNNQTMTSILEAVVREETTNQALQVERVSLVSKGWKDELNNLTLCAVFPDGLWYHLTQGGNFLTFEELSKKLNEGLEKLDYPSSGE